MINNLKNKIKRNRNIVENFSYLSLAQLFNVFFPLITYPYLLKVLGIELYGEVIYAQVIATYFVILIAFGFNTSGAKEVAIHRNDKQKLSEIFCTIMAIKIFFFIASLLVFSFILVVAGFDSEHCLLYLFSFFICFNDLLFPQWFFQGIEKIKYITIINFLIKVVFLVLIFLCVQNRKDYLLVPALNASGAFVGGLVVLYVVFVKEKIFFIVPKMTAMILYSKKNMPLFLSEIIISVKDRFNVIIIGSLLGMDDVAIYDLGIKIANLFMTVIGVINNAVFPKMAIEKNTFLLRKVMKFSVIFISISVVLTILLVPFVMNVISNDLKNSDLPIQVLLLSPIIMSLSLPLSRNGLVVFDKYKLMLWGMLFTSLFYLLCIAFGYVFNLLDNVLSFSIITVFVYIFELMYRIIVCKREKIF